MHDLADTDLYQSGDLIKVADLDKDGIRTFLAAPLVSGGKLIGCIEAYRREVRPFAPDEIALLETFAAQAVIAIQNIRQFKALEALDGEILISQRAATGVEHQWLVEHRGERAMKDIREAVAVYSVAGRAL